MLVVIGLDALFLKGYFFYRNRKKSKKSVPHSESGSPSTVSVGQPASSEPDTAPLQEETGKPRSAPLGEAGLPDMNALPDGCNGVLVIDCLIDTDIRLRRFCVVNTEQVKIIIGRGDTDTSDADISIEHPMISRSHARLESNGEHMTLSDLGSSWGTAINGIPCLPGEVMFIDITDEIFLGDVQLHISILKSEAGAS